MLWKMHSSSSSSSCPPRKPGLTFSVIRIARHGNSLRPLSPPVQQRRQPRDPSQHDKATGLRNTGHAETYGGALARRVAVVAEGGKQDVQAVEKRHATHATNSLQRCHSTPQRCRLGRMCHRGWQTTGTRLPRWSWWWVEKDGHDVHLSTRPEPKHSSPAGTRASRPPRSKARLAFLHRRMAK